MEAVVQRVRTNIVSALDEGLQEIVRIGPVGPDSEKDLRRELEQKLEHEQKRAQRLNVALERTRQEKDDVKEALKAVEARLKQTQGELNQAVALTHLTVQNAKLESKEQNRIENQNLVEKVAQLGARNTMLEAQLKEAKACAGPILPSDRGNAGESEIEQMLQKALVGFMTVRNVSKVGHGHEMDLELTSRDGLVKIRVDVKNAARVPEDEITRFYSDIDGLTPAVSGAILFMRCGLRGEAARGAGASFYSKRGTTHLYQVGWWACDVLIETIHEIVLAQRMEAAHGTKAGASDDFTGSKEVMGAVDALCQLSVFQNEQAAKAVSSLDQWRSLGAEKNRVAADSLRAAHALNPRAVPKQVLKTFEKHVPKRKRGRPPSSTVSDVSSAEAVGASRSRKRVKKEE